MSKLWTTEETQPFATPWREAVVLRVTDGDTVKLRVDLGFDVEVKAITRLLSENAVLTADKADDGVDAWETRGNERVLGKIAKARVEALIPFASVVHIWSFKGKGAKGKWGRWLAVILYRCPKENGWRCLGETLVAEGHATRETY